MEKNHRVERDTDSSKKPVCEGGIWLSAPTRRAVGCDYFAGGSGAGWVYTTTDCGVGGGALGVARLDPRQPFLDVDCHFFQSGDALFHFACLRVPNPTCLIKLYAMFWARSPGAGGGCCIIPHFRLTA